MIKLQRKPKPQILVENEKTWTINLLGSISKYGSYKKIPKKEKEKLLVHYRHEQIKSVLFDSSLEKCAFCETKPSESGNIEVEHFVPKSMYPVSTFDWENFLPACRKCNSSKDDHDTKNEPIVNPYDLDPETVFSYRDILITAKENQYQKVGEQTIKVCSLNSVRLMKPRADILISLHSFSASIGEAVEDYFESDTDLKRRNRKRKLEEALEIIECLSNPSERFSGFCRSYLRDCTPYQEAKKIVTSQ